MCKGLVQGKRCADQDLLESTQQIACKMITKHWDNCYDELLYMTNLPSLADRRLHLKLCSLYKIVHNMTCFPPDIVVPVPAPYFSPFSLPSHSLCLCSHRNFSVRASCAERELLKRAKSNTNPLSIKILRYSFDINRLQSCTLVHAVSEEATSINSRVSYKQQKKSPSCCILGSTSFLLISTIRGTGAG